MKKQETASKENDATMNAMASAAEVIDLTNEYASQEIDYDLVSSGPLYFDKRNIAPGYTTCFVADEPGQVEMYKRWGYDVVIDKFRVGDERASTTTRFGSAVTVQSKCGRLLVLMAIRDDLHAKLMAYRESKNKERDKAMLGKIDGISDYHQTFQGEAMGEYKITRK